jgi:hypothetical protein
MHQMRLRFSREGGKELVAEYLLPYRHRIRIPPAVIVNQEGSVPGHQIIDPWQDGC